MTREERAKALWEEHRDWFRAVPRADHPNVCRFCRGPVKGYAQCYACLEVIEISGFSKDTGTIIPMSIVPEPSPYYSALQNYKRLQWKEFGPPLAAFAFLWLTGHWEDIAEIAGGTIDLVSVVPSKRSLVKPNQQPLRRLLSPLGDLVIDTLTCENPDLYGRTKYVPEMFSVDDDIGGARMILIEDTWITGATAVSAAGALLSAGAEQVVICPIARRYKSIEDNPEYDALIEQLCDPSAPRVN